MGLRSLLGFGVGSLAPLTFGVVMDSTQSWELAYSVLAAGEPSLSSPPAYLDSIVLTLINNPSGDGFFLNQAKRMTQASDLRS